MREVEREAGAEPEDESMTETYYAIRIGDPRRHHPYLWLGEDGQTPVLFPTQEKAFEAHDSFERGDCAKVVRVRVCFWRQGRGGKG